MEAVMDHPLLFLRRVLIVDAATSAACGLLLLVDTPLFADLFGLPAALLREVGIIFLPFAALVAVLATRDTISTAGVWIVILGNIAFVLASVALLTGGFVSPTRLGEAFVIAQAVVVAVIAEAEYLGLRKAERLAA
jgi:hypothetical protein